MICIPPQTQRRKDWVISIDYAVTVASFIDPIEPCKGIKAIGSARPELSREVAKQLPAVIDDAIPVTIQREPRIVGTSSRP